MVNYLHELQKVLREKNWVVYYLPKEKGKGKNWGEIFVRKEKSVKNIDQVANKKVLLGEKFTR